MNQPLANIAAFVVAQLPDSMEQRERVLSDLLTILPARHPMRERVFTMLAYLASHRQQQLEFAGLFTSPGGKR